MRKSMLLAAFTASALMFSATTVHADYYQYTDELRKPGQTVEEAKKEQLEQYQKYMGEKYNQKVQLERGPLALSDEQKSKLKALNADKREFALSQQRERKNFYDHYWKEVDQLLTPKQAKILRMNHTQWKQKDHHGQLLLKRPSGYTGSY